MKILHTNMHKGWGGQPNRILTTMLGLRERGHEVHLVGPEGALLHARARERGFAVPAEFALARGFRPHRQLPDIRAMRGLLERERYDVIDTHGSQDTWTVVAAMRSRSIPRPAFVRTRHNTFPVARHVMNRWLYRQVDHVITISPQVIPLMQGLLPGDAFTAIYSAPDPERFEIADSREEVRGELGFGPDDEVIGVVARLAPEKGHRVLLEAAPEILEARPDAKFLFVGKGRSRPAIEEQVAALGIGDRVNIAGFREDVPRMLLAMDVFCLPCTSGESLGTSILEAFLMERPVVACDVGGVCESVREGETGHLVMPGDPGALAGAVVDLLSDRERAKRWAAAGKALVEAQFTPAMIADKTLEVYQQAMARARAR